ncbi:MAG: hypothetical protein Q8851_01950, partial [Sweet potato little leaf phytoplasma]|nr:hypothetical protein [Sweet potato little leaf phytoplasma]
AVESEIVLNKDSTIVHQLSLVARISRVPLLVPPVGNAKATFIYINVTIWLTNLVIGSILCFLKPIINENIELGL